MRDKLNLRPQHVSKQVWCMICNTITKSLPLALKQYNGNVIIFYLKISSYIFFFDKIKINNFINTLNILFFGKKF